MHKIPAQRVITKTIMYVIWAVLFQAGGAWGVGFWEEDAKAESVNAPTQKLSNGKGKRFWTYPMPPKIIPTSPLKLEPAYAIPEPFEAYRLKTSEMNPKKPVGKIRVYDFDFRGKRKLIGELPVGQVVAPEAARRFSNEHYYSIKFNEKMAWIAGKNLAIESFTPPVN